MKVVSLWIHNVIMNLSHRNTPDVLSMPHRPPRWQSGCPHGLRATRQKPEQDGWDPLALFPGWGLWTPHVCAGPLRSSQSSVGLGWHWGSGGGDRWFPGRIEGALRIHRGPLPSTMVEAMGSHPSCPGFCCVALGSCGQPLCHQGGPCGMDEMSGVFQPIFCEIN